MHELFDWIYSIVVALFLAMIIHIFLFVPTKVAGSSMYPTLEDGQYLIVSKLGHVFRQTPDYGEIVIIDSRTQRMRSWADDLSEPAFKLRGAFQPKRSGTQCLGKACDR